MNVKYQIFVSSTYEDLKEERTQVVKAILEMGHVPVGMEMFSAADEAQWKLITRQIDESDYYVAILAHRYGSMDGTISYTEKEYDYAIEKGIPALAFLIDEKATWPANHVDTESYKVEALKQFKEKAKLKPVGIWKSADDLYGKVSIALMKQMSVIPRTGWVRASEVVGPDVMTELTRLSKENADLRNQLLVAMSQAASAEKEDRERTIRTMQRNTVKVNFWYEYATDWSEPIDVTLYDIFWKLAPELMIEKSTADSINYLGKMLNPDRERPLRKTFPVPSNSTKAWLADLVTLELVEPSRRKHAIKDTNEYWTLTKKGREVYAHVRRARLEAGLHAESDEAPQPREDATSANKQTATKKKARGKKTRGKTVS